MNYTLICATTTAALQELVDARIAEGWVPQGGVSVTYDTHDVCYMLVQAMVLVVS